MAEIMWIKRLLVFLSLSCLKLSAQEVLPEDSASSAGPLSFLDFVTLGCLLVVLRFFMCAV